MKLQLIESMNGILPTACERDQPRRHEVLDCCALKHVPVLRCTQIASINSLSWHEPERSSQYGLVLVECSLESLGKSAEWIAQVYRAQGDSKAPEWYLIPNEHAVSMPDPMC